MYHTAHHKILIHSVTSCIACLERFRAAHCWHCYWTVAVLSCFSLTR